MYELVGVLGSLEESLLFATVQSTGLTSSHGTDTFSLSISDSDILLSVTISSIRSILPSSRINVSGTGKSRSFLTALLSTKGGACSV